MKDFFQIDLFLEDAKYYVRLFSDLDRLSQLQTYYNNCHKVSQFLKDGSYSCSCIVNSLPQTFYKTKRWKEE